jgi:hypothetical protein
MWREAASGGPRGVLPIGENGRENRGNSRLGLRVKPAITKNELLGGLRHTWGGQRWWPGDELCQPAKVLRDRRQGALELGTARPT